MRFVLTYVVDGFTRLSERPVFTVPGDPVVLVAIEAHERDPRDETKPVTLLVATVDLDPPPKAASGLRQLAAGELPDGTTVDPERVEVWGDHPFLPRFGELPGSLQEFSRTVYSMLSSAAVRAYEVVRWRFDIAGAPRPYGSRGIEWSDDGAEWYEFPTDVHIRVGSARVGTPLGQERVDEVNHLLERNAEEPLGHYILREARASLGRHNASALVMAMSAAEIGLKQLVSRLVPDAGWLVENVPSPPLVRMLIEYLPHLPLVNAGAGLVPPPRAILEALRKGVPMRNSAAHIGTRHVDADDVERVVDAVNDLLWLFDYYAGEDWAVQYLSDSVQIGLGLREPHEWSSTGAPTVRCSIGSVA